MTDKSHQHLHAMTQRTDMSAFDRSAIRDVLRDNERYRNDLAAEPLRGDRWAELEGRVVELEERICYMGIERDGALHEKAVAIEKNKVAGKLVGGLRSSLKCMTDLLDTGEEVRPFTDLHYRANKQLYPNHAFIRNILHNICVTCGAVESAHE